MRGAIPASLKLYKMNKLFKPGFEDRTTIYALLAGCAGVVFGIAAASTFFILLGLACVMSVFIKYL